VLRRSFRFGLLVGVLGGALAAVVKAVQSRTSSTPEVAAPAAWTPLPDSTPVVVPERPEATPAAKAPAAPKAPRPSVAIADLQESPNEPAPTPSKAAAKVAATSKKKAAPKLDPWVEPVGDGEAPDTHPIKAKLSSGIFHSPGGLNYDRTKPDRCYRDATAAEADGLRPAKR
jgi:hypothetical protein